MFEQKCVDLQTLTIPSQLLSSNTEQDGNKPANNAEIIDVVGSPGTPSTT